MSPAPLPNPIRLSASNVLPLPLGYEEPGVEVKKESLETETVFDGKIKRAFVGLHDFPATNDGPLRAEAAPGSGVKQPGGTNVYYLDLAPNFETPMHRTVSTDFLVAQVGTPTLLTPKGPFKIVDGKGTYEETEENVLQEGQLVVQRGQMHAWKNDTDEWVRILCFVVDAKAQEVELETSGEKKTLEELWI